MPIERLEREFDIEVEWKGLEIHPELPPEGVSREVLHGGERSHSSDEILNYLAEGVDLSIHRPPFVANSHLALEAAEFARDQGAHAPLHRRLFEAYFQKGLNIGDPEVVVGLAGEVGLDVAELRRALAERRYESRLAEALLEAALAGISGVPTLIIGDERFTGARPYEVLREALEGCGARPREKSGLES